jgi:hypothetical protein
VLTHAVINLIYLFSFFDANQSLAAAFLLLQYWDKRYKKDEEQFDWYQRYDTLKHILNEVTPKSMDRILMVGCGNSSTWQHPSLPRTRTCACRGLVAHTHGWAASGMSEHMVEDGYAASSVTNVDISPVVIDQMRKKHPDMDCTRLGRLSCEHALVV